MKCKKIQELIMDYIDGEVNQALRKDIASHLNACPSCRSMEQSLKSGIIEPLRTSQRLEAPERIWYRVREAILSRKERLSFTNLVLQWLNDFRIKRPVLVPATATIIVMLFIAVFFFAKTQISQNMLNTHIQEQFQFISQLAENDEEANFIIEDIYLGTSIEKYLL